MSVVKLDPSQPAAARSAGSTCWSCIIASIAVWTVCFSASSAFLRAVEVNPSKLTDTMAARMPRIVITTSISMSVKPPCRRFLLRSDCRSFSVIRPPLKEVIGRVESSDWSPFSTCVTPSCSLSPGRQGWHELDEDDGQQEHHGHGQRDDEASTDRGPGPVAHAVSVGNQVHRGEPVGLRFFPHSVPQKQTDVSGLPLTDESLERLRRIPLRHDLEGVRGRLPAQPLGHVLTPVE